ncbi:MAG: bifunctional adenosylcobinamide kinase/adenosylcobinamide-phosphate guanylyltransferase [Candidatus Omnitrophica bacterium]|jgi:adenosylcobinamide kinase/adenosylcobinamide-phosphate guanylyltransferase|nr:bifunctional adenosylcobinamide kinase/adenosylcobinamide-phosphate guanylyltransferase [Candidatus Omnitrophota bacterium]
MGKIILITGGARSGKSALALKLAERDSGVVFVATAEALDSEMKKRISLHKKSRPVSWHVIEEPRDLKSALKKIPSDTETVIIDCLTLWVSNKMLSGAKEKDILLSAKDILILAKKIKATCVFISNEVGSGIVPENKLARDFRDVAGRVNQLVSQEADKVYVSFCGLQLCLK